MIYMGVGNLKIKKLRFAVSPAEGVEKRESLYMVGGNVNWCKHYGKQYGCSLKN